MQCPKKERRTTNLGQRKEVVLDFSMENGLSQLLIVSQTARKNSENILHNLKRKKKTQKRTCPTSIDGLRENPRSKETSAVLV